MASPIISPRELAVAIGVSESSLKRWADEGVIKVSKTAGGHRRITIGEAIRFIRSIRAPLLRPDALGLGDLPTNGDPVLSTDAPADRLFEYLCAGQERDARGLILSLYLGGQSVVEIADGPIRATLERLGELWLHDPAGVSIEHHAVDICIQAVHRLRQVMEPNDEGPLAIGGAAPGDPYLLPSLLVAVALASEGWRVVNLGPDTPFDAFVVAADRYKPQLVWLSVSSIHEDVEMSYGVERIAHALADRGITLVVGGRALRRLSIPDGLIQRGESLADLMVVANAVRNQQDDTMAGSAGGASPS